MATHALTKPQPIVYRLKLSRAQNVQLNYAITFNEPAYEFQTPLEAHHYFTNQAKSLENILFHAIDPGTYKMLFDLMRARIQSSQEESHG